MIQFHPPFAAYFPQPQPPKDQVMSIKLYANSNSADPLHEIDSTEFPEAPPGIIHVAQTGKYYIFGYRIAGEPTLAYFEAEVVSINFALNAFGKDRDKS